jgi:hypothetical protein
LLHAGKAGFQWASGKKLYLLVWIQTKMLKDIPCYDLKIAAEDIEPYCLASKLSDRLKLRPGDERSGRARHVTGYDFDRGSPDRCGDPGADRRIIIDFSGD